MRRDSSSYARRQSSLGGASASSEPVDEAEGEFVLLAPI
jgi:hypothetical protein